MSKIINDIEERIHGYRVPSKINCYIGEIKVSDKIEEIERDFLHKVTVGVSYYVTGYCQIRDIPAIKENAILELKEIFFGDLRGLVRQLNMALFAQDVPEMRRLLDEIGKEIN